MYNGEGEKPQLVLDHPDYSSGRNMFRMNGTSMATAAASGVVALMLEAHPELTPNQVKHRLLQSARPALIDDGQPVHNNIFQQGTGRIWAPDAVLGEIPLGEANLGMDIHADLDHGLGWVDQDGDGYVEEDEVDAEELSYHYQGPIRSTNLLDEAGQAVGRLYYVTDPDGAEWAMGVADAVTGEWVSRTALENESLIRKDSRLVWLARNNQAGGWEEAHGESWVGRWAWSAGKSWDGGWAWSDDWVWASGWAWSGCDSMVAYSTHWVHDDGTVDSGTGDGTAMAQTSQDVVLPVLLSKIQFP
jgi:hypothetical protein